MPFVLAFWFCVGFIYFKVACDYMFFVGLTVFADFVVSASLSIVIFFASLSYARALIFRAGGAEHPRVPRSRAIALLIPRVLLVLSAFALLSRIEVFGFSKELSRSIEVFGYDGNISTEIVTFIVIFSIPIALHFMTVVFGANPWIEQTAFTAEKTTRPIEKYRPQKSEFAKTLDDDKQA